MNTLPEINKESLDNKEVLTLLSSIIWRYHFTVLGIRESVRNSVFCVSHAKVDNERALFDYLYQRFENIKKHGTLEEVDILKWRKIILAEIDCTELVESDL